jgi:hypothetical protein
MNIGVVIGIIGILVSFIGIPITFIIARRSRQLPDLRHTTDFDILLKPTDGLFDRGLAMRIGDHSINSISRSRIALWNHRGDTVRGVDIVESDPLRVQFAEGNSALQVRTLRMSRPQTKLTATIDTKDEASINIIFDFLDAGDGAIFEVIHQGTKQSTILGTIRGAKIRNYGDVELDPEDLEAIGKSRLHRHFDPAPISRLTSLAGYFVIGSIFTILAVAAAASVHPGHLINPNGYNLRTMTGQSAFAQAVQNSGISNTGFGIALTIAFSIVACYSFGSWLRTFYKNSKRIVPKSVIAFIADDNMQGNNAGNLPPSEPQAGKPPTSD